MNFSLLKWDKTNYSKFIKYLKSISNKNYKNFQSKLIKNVKIIGVSIPNLKKIAKEIAKGDYISFIKYNTHITFEETLIHGLIIEYIKDEKIMFDLLDDFLKYIDNWATCDIVCSNTKKLKKINNIQKYINSNNPWIIRFGLVTLLNYFIEKDNLSYIFNICTKINIDHYYVKMAISWLLSCCYIKYPKETVFFLKKRKLDKFTHNKTISKICDSKKVDNDCKKNIKLLKV